MLTIRSEIWWRSLSYSSNNHSFPLIRESDIEKLSWTNFINFIYIYHGSIHREYNFSWSIEPIQSNLSKFFYNFNEPHINLDKKDICLLTELIRTIFRHAQSITKQMQYYPSNVNLKLLLGFLRLAVKNKFFAAAWKAKLLLDSLINWFLNHSYTLKILSPTFCRSYRYSILKCNQAEFSVMAVVFHRTFTNHKTAGEGGDHFQLLSDTFIRFTDT